jgi:Zn-dependent metalloprotease
MGEDIAKMFSFLRNMQDPTKATPPQPGIYRGQYWADPNSKIDYGNVHTDSGPPNRCFFLLSTSVGMDLAFKIYLRMLRSLPSLPSFIDFRDAYLASASALGKAVEMQSALNVVGLGPAAVSDWRKTSQVAA